MLQNVQIALMVNGEPTEVAFAAYKTLLEVLREDLNLCGTKHGCELGECGACAVLLDGQPVLSCLVLGVECGGRAVTTVEGLVTDGRLHPLQEAFADLGAAQCGYCTPGFLVTAKALLDEHAHPTRDQIKEALSGCLCRCTGYQQIFEAVEAAIDRSGAWVTAIEGRPVLDTREHYGASASASDSLEPLRGARAEQQRRGWGPGAVRDGGAPRETKR
jgi:aerobic-type carbon monoxide dehydrogenase small subunit (CoxS/CutS family)